MELLQGSGISRSRLHSSQVPVLDFSRYHHPEKREPQPQVIGGGRQLRILITLHYDSIKDIYERELKEKGYDVKTATTINEALELYKKEKFDVIFSHFNPSGEDGVEAVLRLREKFPRAIVHLMSAFEMRELLPHPEQLPAELISKPVQLPVYSYELLPYIEQDEKTISAR